MALNLLRLVIKIPLVFTDIRKNVCYFVKVQVLMHRIKQVQNVLEGVFSLIPDNFRLDFYHQKHKFLFGK